MIVDAPKLLADPAAREARRLQLSEPHVAPLVALVQHLRDQHPDRAIPDFDPWDGGVNAEIFYLLEAPGPMAVKSSFISRDNPDETAKNFLELNAEASIDRKRTATWNIVPWYLGGGDKIRAAPPADIRATAPLLMGLLALFPRLRALVLIGRHAQRAAPIVASLRPMLPQFHCPHPSPMFINRAPGNRAVKLAVLREVAATVVPAAS